MTISSVGENTKSSDSGAAVAGAVAVAAIIFSKLGSGLEASPKKGVFQVEKGTPRCLTRFPQSSWCESARRLSAFVLL